MARDHHGGDIWSAIRWGLSNHRERLIAAFDTGSYEAESAILDEIARKVTKEIEPMVATYTAKKATRP